MARSSGSRKDVRRSSIGGYNTAAADIARYGVEGARVAAPGQEDAAGVAAPGQEAPTSPVYGTRRRRGQAADDGLDPSRSAWAGGEHAISIGETDRLAERERRGMRAKCAVSAAILLALVLGCLCTYGATSLYVPEYSVFTPLEVFRAIGENVYTLVARLGFLPAHDTSAYWSEWPLYYDVIEQAGIIAITLVCSAMLAVSGMLYQNVFRNPIAGPGILGVSSGVSLGNAIMVLVYGASAATMIVQRYLLCYLLGAAIIVVVMAAGFKLSGKGKPLDVVNMMLVGSVLSQLVGFVVTFITAYVVDPDVYEQYLSLSEMLVVDTSAFSYACLAVVAAVTFVPIVLMRFKMNALSFDELEVRLMGVDLTPLRTVALISGGLMILAAQVHIGAVSMVSVIVPFLSRSIFGCEFRNQLVGNVFIGSILMLACRIAVNVIPFVGDGLGIGTAACVFVLPLFLLIVALHMRGWE